MDSIIMISKENISEPNKYYILCDMLISPRLVVI